MNDKLPSLYGSIGDREDISIGEITYTKVPKSEVITPKNGYICMLNRYWYVTDDDCVLFYGDSPQCNQDKRIMEYRSSMKQYKIEFIPVAYRKPDRD